MKTWFKTLIATSILSLGIPLITTLITDNNNDDDFYLNLAGESSIKLCLNNKFEEPGYQAYDSKDGDLTEEVEFNKIDTSKAGEHTITYKVTNSKKKTRTKERKVNVIKNCGSGSDDGIIVEEVNAVVTEITLDNFNEQIEKGKVYDGIKINTTTLTNQYINKFRLQKSLVYALSITSIVKDSDDYADIAICNSSYVNTEASATIVTNGSIERIYNNNDNCFSNYGVFYFTDNKLNHTVIDSDSVNDTIINSKTRNTFVYQDVIVDNGVIINDSESTSKNNAICQTGPNTLKLFTFDGETTYNLIGQRMISEGCQTGILLTEGDTVLYKSQYSSTLNVQKGTDSLTDSIIFFYEKDVK